MPDVKLALRTLLQAPLVNLVAVVSLALGIGANGAIFSLFHQILQRPLPVEQPERLVNLSGPGPQPGGTSCNQAGDCEQVFSYPMFRDLQRQQNVFTDLVAHRALSLNLAFEGETLSSEGELVSGSYFPVLGLQPHVGRLIGPEDDLVVGESPVVVLAHDYWRNHFGGEPSVVGKTLIVNGQPLTIVGVAPEGFRGTTLGNRPQVYVPITMRSLLQPQWSGFDSRFSYWAYLFGRLAPGVSMQQAEIALNLPYSALLTEVEAPQLDDMSAATMARFKARRVLLSDGRKGQSSTIEEAMVPIMVLFVVALAVLLIACANVAGLLLSRSASRRGDLVVRLSIGATRGRLISQLLTESVLLAALAGIASIAVAKATLISVVSMLPAEATSTIETTLDWQSLAFAAVLALGTGLAFGLVPALESTRVDLASVLNNQSGRRSTRGAMRFRSVLVTAQIALSTSLLIAAGLFARSLLNISRVELGLDVDNLVTFAISPVRNGYPPERSMAIFEAVEERLAALPGVTAATASMVPVLAGSNWNTGVSVQGFEADSDTNVLSSFTAVGPGFFRTMGVTLFSGREFTDGDVAGAPKVVVVNQAFADKFGLGRDAVGRFMGTASGPGAELDREIVGLVQDTKYSDVKRPVPPVCYIPYRQREDLGSIYFYARTTLAPEESLRAVAAVVKELDPNLPVEELRTMPQQIRENVAVDRIVTTLSVAFGSIAALLAAVGLYGVLAYSVSQRTREIGLRMALGADRARVRRLILGQVSRMTLVGTVIGVAAAFGLGTLASSLLFEVDGFDPAVFVAATGLLAAVAFGAGLLPALRASRIAPITALHYE